MGIGTIAHPFPVVGGLEIPDHGRPAVPWPKGRGIGGDHGSWLPVEDLPRAC